MRLRIHDIFIGMRRPPTKITDELRSRVVAFCTAGHTLAEAAARFKIGDRTVTTILRHCGVYLPHGPKSKDPEHLPVSSDLPLKERKRRRKENLARWARNHPEKMREYQRHYRKNNLEISRERCREYHRKNGKILRERYKIRRQIKSKQRRAAIRNDPEKLAQHQKYDREYKRANGYRCNTQVRKRLSDPKKAMRFVVGVARQRAKKFGRQFDEGLFDMLPATHCRCCNRELDYTTRKKSGLSRSPSLDRVDNSKGYTVENTRVICLRCNRLKGDATANELRFLVAYMEERL